MCLLRWLLEDFFAMSKDQLLSKWMVFGLGVDWPRVFATNREIRRDSFVTNQDAMYSASQEDVDTAVSFLSLQQTAPPVIINGYPLADLPVQRNHPSRSQSI